MGFFHVFENGQDASPGRHATLPRATYGLSTPTGRLCGPEDGPWASAAEVFLMNRFRSWNVKKIKTRARDRLHRHPSHASPRTPLGGHMGGRGHPYGLRRPTAAFFLGGQTLKKNLCREDFVLVSTLHFFSRFDREGFEGGAGQLCSRAFQRAIAQPLGPSEGLCAPTYMGKTGCWFVWNSRQWQHGG